VEAGKISPVVRVVPVAAADTRAVTAVVGPVAAAVGLAIAVVGTVAVGVVAVRRLPRGNVGVVEAKAGCRVPTLG
jgi:hypothetical protein